MVDGGLAIDALSWQARVLWAKTGSRETPNLWEALPVHLADTGEIARFLWREWLAQATRRYICEGVGMDAPDVESLIVWLAAIHDVGKATPAFEAKVAQRAELVREAGLDFAQRPEPLPHSNLGAVIVEDWLLNRSWDDTVAEAYASLIGSHHGVCPDADDLKEIRFRGKANPRATMGDASWKEVQDELLAWTFANSGVEQIEASLRTRHIPTYTQILMTGLVIMADWIASNTDLFVLEDKYAGWDHSQARAESAWRALHLPKRLKTDLPADALERVFHDRFPSLPKEARLKPMQAAVAQAALDMHEPGLIIVEEEMGRGKTEAAFLAAEFLMQGFGCNGIAFFLPTQATSNAMFARAESWMRRLLEAQGTSIQQDLHLLHGKAALNEDYAALPTWGVSWMGDDGAQNDSIIAHQWFGGSKRGLLAPFVVGTVDQLLMAALKTKHVQLRHLGLAGKVVVIDEVHAYDTYMGEYLKRILEFLGSYHVPVILLSATLPPSRREVLLKAYRGQLRKHSLKAQPFQQPHRLPSGDPIYPLMSITGGNNRNPPMYQAPTTSAANREVSIRFIGDDQEALVQELESAMIEGGCVCVLRDTVRRAQETYRLLRERFDTEVCIAHARFIALDRAENDRRLTKLLGPSNGARPKSLIVVGTQVLEQSLDIDVDLLITDVAPVDLLIQRIGRLHRHQRGEGESLRPCPLRKPRCLITGVEFGEGRSPQFASGVDAVYPPAVLMRTILALQERMGERGSLLLPSDIAPLVERVYDSPFDVPGTWESAYEEALTNEGDIFAKQKESAKEWILPKPSRYSLLDLMRDRVSIHDETLGRATVRGSEDSIEVVVVQRCESGYELLPWVAERLKVDSHLGTGAEAPEDATARAEALCTVCLPPALSASYTARDVLDALEKQGIFAGWQDSRWLRGALPLVLDSRGEAVITCRGREYCLVYRKETGLEMA